MLGGERGPDRRGVVRHHPVRFGSLLFVLANDNWF